MSTIALKILLSDWAKYLGLVIGIAFSTMLMANQVSIFCGLMLRTASQIIDIVEPDIWVMDPRVRHVDEIEPLTDTQLYRVRGVAGVAWAVPLLKSMALIHAGGSVQQVIMIGVDDGSLVGAPRQMVLGSAASLRRPDAMIIDRVGYQAIWPGREPAIGEIVELNDRRAVIVGICDASPPFATFPVVFARYSDAVLFAPQPRKRLSFILVRAAPGVEAHALALRIRAETGLQALTARGFMWRTIWYYIAHTGIPINFGITVTLGFIVGAAVVGQTFYLFIVENLRHFAALKAIGVSNRALMRMVLVQGAFIGFVGYGIGIGLAALFFDAMARVWTEARGMAMPWQVMLGTAAAVIAMIALAGAVSLRRVLRLDPAIVFRE
jgi:putative ABC transport system permease protein